MKEGMKMPGFTADASLYNPRRYYNLGVNRGVEEDVVIPQLVKCSEYKPENYGGSNRQCYLACSQDPLCSQSVCEYGCDYGYNPPPLPYHLW